MTNDEGLRNAAFSTEERVVVKIRLLIFLVIWSFIRHWSFVISH
jgi:hypothetical protein